MTPLRVVNAVAPIRICDNGGWTDTWFARCGKVFNIAVEPLVEVQVEVHRRDDLEGRVVLHAEDYGDRYAFSPGDLPDRHPLLEAVVDELGVPDQVAVQITIHSDAPVGASTGTSAAVAVALVGAIDALSPGRMTPHEVAYLAHRVEVERLGLQAGIQDQLCAAYGGICFIDIFEYPRATVSQIRLPERVAWELERRLLLVGLGRSHVSSEVHARVIERLEAAGASSAPLERLRHMAERARDAAYAGDLTALGRAMSENTAIQGELHPDLVCPDARRVIDIAREHAALGWKVNGAGGDGGSLTILCSHDMAQKRRLGRALQSADPMFQTIPVRLAERGLRVWEAPLRS